MSTRIVLWRGLEGWREWATGWHAEGAEVELGDDRLAASGTQLGSDPTPYRLDYDLETGPRWVTERLNVRVRTGTEERRLDLRRATDGTWTANGKPVPEVDGSVDCDLSYSPLTNSMPVLRERLLDEGATPMEFVMAWVDVPSLAVLRSRQRYEPIDTSRVRYADPSHRDGFTADLEFDADGLLVRYEHLAQRV